MTSRGDGHYLALCGGVGGAKLADGLAQLLPPDVLTTAVNVGDDFEHLGLTICPDIDTVLYTLAGLAHPQQGWGRDGESWQVFEELGRIGGETWFRLGDLDIALHLLRRSLLDDGQPLDRVTADLARRLGVTATVTPASNQSLRTIVHTDAGALAFQDYFVRRRCEPAVQRLEYRGAQQAEPAPQVMAALEHPRLAGVILCPSNPYLSIAPMLAVTELRRRLCALSVPVVAVSPIVGGQALKGPAGKMMRELGVTPRADVIADLYADFVDAVLIDRQDQMLAEDDARLQVADTVMKSSADRTGLARVCLDLIAKLASDGATRQG